MKISDIDKNLAVASTMGLKDVVWFDVKEAPISVHGLYCVEKGKGFTRMPEETAKQVSDGIDTSVPVSGGSTCTKRTLHNGEYGWLTFVRARSSWR